MVLKRLLLRLACLRVTQARLCADCMPLGLSCLCAVTPQTIGARYSVLDAHKKADRGERKEGKEANRLDRNEWINEVLRSKPADERIEATRKLRVDELL